MPILTKFNFKTAINQFTVAICNVNHVVKLKGVHRPGFESGC